MLKCLFIGRSESGRHNDRMTVFAWRLRLSVCRYTLLRRTLQRWLLLWFWAGGLLLAPAMASPLEHDHDRAERAVQAGQVLSLQSMLQKLQLQYPGQVLEVELEDDDGRWVYEVKLLQAGGQLLKIKLDAQTAEVLQSKIKAHKK